jgi:ankyrin repeat protein
MAIQNGNLSIVESLLDFGADPNFVAEASSGGRGSFAAEMVPLAVAAENGVIAIGRLLLERGADPNTVLADGTTPLMIAAELGNVHFTRLLLEYDAHVDHRRADDGVGPLFMAGDSF